MTVVLIAQDERVCFAAGTYFFAPTMRHLTVAVVDDDPAVCASLKFSLELEGFSVRVYGSATAFLDAAGAVDADCLVIDQRMPGLTGLDLIGQLRDQNVTIPAILIVSESNAGVGARAARANIPIVEKPFFGDSLVQSIRQVCGRGRR